MRNFRPKAGFTLVELLIVIVVIGILAAITIVAYRGINERAYNAQIIEGARQYRAALVGYYLKEGHYPQTLRETEGERVAMTCLGSGYIDKFCGKITGVDVYEDDFFNTQFSGFLGNAPPRISIKNLPVGSETFTGAVYGSDTTDPAKAGTLYARTIQYALNGANADCVLPGAYSYRLSDTPPTTACEIILEPLP